MEIDAYAGIVAWSRWDPAIERYRLVVDHDGEVELPPVRPSKSSFDIDLGPDARGRPTAVYSRCRRVRYEGDRSGCDLYKLDMRSWKERRIRAASTPRASEHMPTIWRDRLVFVRDLPGYRRRGTLHSVRIGKEARARQLPGGPGRDATFGSGPLATELRGRHLAYVWRVGDDVEAQSSGFVAADVTLSLRLHRLGRRTKTLWTERDVFAESLMSPSFEKGWLYWGRERGRRPAPSEIWRHRLGSRVLQRAAAPDPLISVQRSEGSFRIVTGQDRLPESRSSCSVGLTDTGVMPSAPRVCTVATLDGIRFKAARR